MLPLVGAVLGIALISSPASSVIVPAMTGISRLNRVPDVTELLSLATGGVPTNDAGVSSAFAQLQGPAIASLAAGAAIGALAGFLASKVL